MSNVEDLERFQPLLRQGSSGGAEASREEWIDPVEDGARSAAVSWISMTEAVDEVISLIKVWCPILFTSLFLFSKSLISIHYLGVKVIGEDGLAGGSLAIGIANITGYSLLKGLSMGMEPICGQAYGASKRGILCLTFQRAFLLLLITTIPMSILWFNVNTILLWLGQDVEIAYTARLYILYSLPDLLAQACLHPLRIFLRTQNITRPVTYSATIALLFHIPINHVLVSRFQMGVKGVALACGINTIIINLGVLVYLLFSPSTVIKPWSNITVDCLQGWNTLIKLAIPSAVSVCLEWWWYEFMTIFCGWLENPKANIASMGILIQMTGLIYAFPFSLASAVSAKVGQHLGGDNPHKARQASIIGLAISAVCGVLAMVFIFLIKDLWGSFFSKDTDIIRLTAMALPIIGLCELGNNPQTVACGVLRGCARPNLGANINFASFYLVGLPVAVVAAFWYDGGIVGLFLGLAAAQLSCAFMMLFVIIKTDWNLQAVRAKELLLASSRNNNLQPN